MDEDVVVTSTQWSSSVVSIPVELRRLSDSDEPLVSAKAEEWVVPTQNTFFT